LGSAICYSAIIVGFATVVLYLAGAILTSVTQRDNSQLNGVCSMQPNVLSFGNETDSSIHYINYLRYTGISVLAVIVGVSVSCFVCCGLCLGFPRPVKIAAAICIIPAAIFLAFYVAWLAMGTYLLARMDHQYIIATTICRNILVYIIFLYIYLIFIIGFGIIVAIWKINRIAKGGKKAAYTRPTKSAKSSESGGVMGKVGGKMGAAKLAATMI
jgi:hypothetical protein